MKKFILSMLVFGLLMAIIPPLSIRAQSVSPATTGKGGSPQGTATGAAVPLPAEKSGYLLPYPGILPDHPLFFLKKFRDTIVEWLISDPLRKGEFYLIQADKSVNTAVFLMNKNNPEAAVASLVLAGDYRQQALAQLKPASDAGKDTRPLIDRMKLAVIKHQEVMSELQPKAGEQASRFAELLRSATQFADELQKQ